MEEALGDARGRWKIGDGRWKKKTKNQKYQSDNTQFFRKAKD
jgi:hypothetical protein